MWCVCVCVVCVCGVCGVCVSVSVWCVCVCVRVWCVCVWCVSYAQLSHEDDGIPLA